MTEEKQRAHTVHASLSRAARGEYSGIPAHDPRADAPEFAPVYAWLREILDGIAAGNPPAADFENMSPDADLRMLKAQFTPEHARLAVHVSTDRFDAAADVARRAGMTEDAALALLLEMACRGSIFHRRDGGRDLFRHVGQAPGKLEFQIGIQTREYQEATGEYIGRHVGPGMFATSLPSWRWAPINERVVTEGRILPYDNAEKLLLEADRVAVCACVCRSVKTTPCAHGDAPYELCLQLGDFADFYVNDLKISHYIDHDEIRRLLKYAMDNQLAVELAGSQQAEIICLCCSCCCGPLEMFRRYGERSLDKITNYDLIHDREACVGCGACVDACLTREGLSMGDDGTLRLHSEKCVGCGVCLRACPVDALSLRLKDEARQYEPPASVFDLYAAQEQARKR